MNNRQPPRFGATLLSWFCSNDDLEMVQGDLDELFRQRIKEGRWYAAVHYYLDLFQLLVRFGAKGKSQYYSNGFIMFKSHLLFAFRVMRKHRFYSVVNLLGLAVGIAGTILIAQFLLFEFSFDRQYPKSKQIARISSEWHQHGAFLEHRAAAVPALVQLFDENYPEVLRFARYHKGSTNIVRYHGSGTEPIGFEEDEVFYADPSFFEIFDIPFTSGSLTSEAPFQVAISASTASKYFGSSSAIGQSLLFDGEFSFEAEVVAVFEDFQKNTHLSGDFILTLKTKERLVAFNIPDNWIWRSFYTYVYLGPDANLPGIENRINDYVSTAKKSYYDRGGYEVKFHLQNLTDIHLHSDLFEEIRPNGRMETVEIIGACGFFLLVISFFNYVSLTTARNMNRTKEVAVRKSAGASRHQLTWQYLFESILLVFIASLLAVGFVLVVFPWAKVYLQLEMDFTLIDSAGFWGMWFLFSLLAGLASGMYPALILSSSSITSLFKGGLRLPDKQGLRKVLVGLQFALSLGLVLSVIVVIRQTTYMSNRDLGIRRNQILVLKGPKIKSENYASQLDRFKQLSGSIPYVEAMTTTSSLPGEVTGAGRDFTNERGEAKFLKIIRVDYDFEKVFDLELLYGRTFTRNFPSGDEQVLLNESAIALLGYENWENAAAGTLSWRNVGATEESSILGMIRDYFPDSNSPAVPTAFILNRRYQAPWDPEFYALELSTPDLAQAQLAVNELQGNWEATFPDEPMSYFFLDEFFQRQFQAEVRLRRMLTAFGLLAIGLACVGLIGMVSYHNLNRLRSIGIRKILGAKSMSLYALLLRENIIPILAATIFSLPFYYFFLRNWLAGYSYVISLDWRLIFLPCVGLLIPVAIIILGQSMQAVRVNPVSILKYE